eukprot:g15359.t1
MSRRERWRMSCSSSRMNFSLLACQNLKFRLLLAVSASTCSGLWRSEFLPRTTLTTACTKYHMLFALGFFRPVFTYVHVL